MANLYGPRIVTDGLICYLDAANRKSYPGSGSTWYDLSGNNNHFSMVGSLSFANGQFTSTATTSNYFIRNPFSHPTTAASIEFWCFSNSGSSNDGLWSYAVGGTGGDNHHLLYNQSNLNLYSIANYASTSIDIRGYWKQIVRTSNRSNGSERLYINGVSRYTTTLSAGTNFTSGGSLIIGQEQDSVGGLLDSTQAFEGKYCIFRIYDKVLNLEEVLQNYNATKGRFGL